MVRGKSYVGKHVCYGNAEGMFVLARIVGEAEVNSPSGPKDVFVVDDRMCGPYGNGVERIRGRTHLRVEKVDLEKDVFDRKPGMDTMTDEQLFVTMLKGKVEVGDAGGMPLGLANMLKAVSEDSLTGMAKEELEKRQGDVGGAGGAGGAKLPDKTNIGERTSHE